MLVCIFCSLNKVSWILRFVVVVLCLRSGFVVVFVVAFVSVFLLLLSFAVASLPLLCLPVMFYVSCFF